MVDVSHLSVNYRTGIFRDIVTNAVREVTVHVPEGSITAIVGESGCGKSTLLRAIAGMVRRSSGTIRIAQRDDRSEHVGLIQVVGQHPAVAFDPRQTIISAIREILEIHRRDRTSESVHALFDTVGIHPELHERYPHELSGGQLQRVSIARALATAPRVLLLDEPTSMLDASVQARVIQILQEIRLREQVTMILVTHDIDLARVVADEIRVMHQGRIIEGGVPSAIFAHPTHPHTRELVEATTMLRDCSGEKRGR